jgi:hypothetical protein
MNTANSQVLPAPPNLIRALLAGFDTIANHVGLILFSIGLDLLLWFGNQVHLFRLIKSYLDWSLQAAQAQTPELVATMRSSEQALLDMAKRYNLISALRSMPLGIPSLMAARAPTESPFGAPVAWEIASAGWSIALWVGLFLIGLFISTLYFLLISQAGLGGKLNWSQAFQNWPAIFGQLLLLNIFYLVLLIGIFIPLSCVLPFALMGGAGLGRFVLIIYGAILIWLLFPLVLSPFGIFVYQDKMWVSVLRGARIARFTLPSTLMLVLVLIILGQGLDMLWNIPVDRSWFMLVGIVGHAFVATSLLAATFIYYRDAGTYVVQRFQQNKA